MATTIAEALKDLQQRIAEREEYRRFYRGEHGVHLQTPELRRALGGHRPFAVNFCKVIVDSLTDRVQVRAVSADAGDEAAEGDERIDEAQDSGATIAAREIWERSALDVTTIAWRYAVDGDAYLGLELASDDRDVVGGVQATVKRIDADMVAPLDDGSLFVQTGEKSGMLVAPDGTTAVFYELVAGGEWVPVSVPSGDGETATIATLEPTDPNGNPLKIIERIRNGDTGDQWGASDLAVAVPQQRAINARQIDLHEISGNAAWPQNWIVGQGASKAAGRIRTRAGAVHGVESSGDAPMSLHQFAAADPAKIRAAIDGAIEDLSVTSGTPLQSTSAGANSSAESRRIAQDGLTRRVMKAHDAIARAIQSMLESALLAIGIEASVDIEWESPEPVAEKDALETATMKLALGVSRRTLLTELGYDAEREALYRADEKAEEQVSMTRAITTGTDTAADLAGLLGGAQP